MYRTFFRVVSERQAERGQVFLPLFYKSPSGRACMVAGPEIERSWVQILLEATLFFKLTISSDTYRIFSVLSRISVYTRQNQ